MGKLEVGVNDLETFCKQNNRLDLLYKGILFSYFFKKILHI